MRTATDTLWGFNSSWSGGHGQRVTLRTGAKATYGLGIAVIALAGFACSSDDEPESQGDTPTDPGGDSGEDSGDGSGDGSPCEGVECITYIKSASPGERDDFGREIAASGDTLVVGVDEDSSGSTGIGGDPSNRDAEESGAVYVFRLTGGAWTQEAYIKASNAESEDAFGSSVALDGDRLVVSAPGEDSGMQSDPNDNSEEDSGAIYVFERTGTQWTEVAYLKVENPGAEDRLSGVSVNGSLLAGGTGEQVFVFEQQAGEWNQSGVLAPPSLDPSGFDVGISAIGIGDGFIAVGNSEDSSPDGETFDPTLPQSGAVYIYAPSNGSWNEEAYLKASNFDGRDWFGLALAVSGNTLVVGAYREESNATGVNGDGTNNDLFSGAAYIFTRSSEGQWSEDAYLKASNTGFDDDFGFAVAIRGERVLIGAGAESGAARGVNGNADDDSAEDAGAAYLFERENGTWRQTAYVKASNTDSFDNFGDAVGIGDGFLAVGAPQEQSPAAGIDGDQTLNQEENDPTFGAVYVYPDSLF